MNYFTIMGDARRWFDSPFIDDIWRRLFVLGLKASFQSQSLIWKRQWILTKIWWYRWYRYHLITMRYRSLLPHILAQILFAIYDIWIATDTRTMNIIKMMMMIFSLLLLRFYTRIIYRVVVDNTSRFHYNIISSPFPDFSFYISKTQKELLV